MTGKVAKRRASLDNALFGSIFDKPDLPEQVMMLSLNDLHPFKDHPFRVLDDEKMQETVDSILEHGVLVPGIARKRAEGGYEIIAGHRRKRASELAGKTEMPFLIRDYSDDEAVIIMVDSNLQREDILPSEKAFAYKMKCEALKHQGKRTGSNTYDLIGENAGDNGRTVQRYIRLTELIKEMLDLVDQKQLGFIAAAELSFLKKEEQEQVYRLIVEIKRKPNSDQAERLKKSSQEGKFDINILESSNKAQKKRGYLKLKTKWRSKFFKETDTDEQIEKIIYELLCQWKGKQEEL